MRRTRHSRRTTVAIGLAAGIIVLAVCGGCGTLRFAPGETQKQNAYLHHRTVQAAALQAKQEEVSPTLAALPDQADEQSEAIMAHYGWPSQLPAASRVDEILSQANEELTETARQQAIQRPEPWDVAGNLLELGVALAGVVGGVYGAKALNVLQIAQQKSKALREIVAGNELFKKRNADSTEQFKKAHKQQSPETRSLVAELK